MFVSLSFRGFVACLAIVQALCGLTRHVLELHRLDEFCVSLQIFLVHVIHDLVLPCRTCPRVFPLYGFSLREAVILCGTSYAPVVSGIRIVSRLCSHRMHTLFLASNFALFSSFSSRDLAVSLVNGTSTFFRCSHLLIHLLPCCVQRMNSPRLML